MAELYEKQPYQRSVAQEASAGNYAVAMLVMSLVQVLKDKGVISFADYRAEVLSQYEALSGESVGGAAGGIFETTLQMLNGLRD